MLDELNRHLKSGDFADVYTLVGSESVMVSEAVEAVRKSVLTVAPDFNRDEFRASEPGVSKMADAARTLPMMAPRRYVHVADIHKIKSKDSEAIVDYLKSPSETTTLVISGQKIDKRTTLGKRLAKNTQFFSFEPPKPHQVAAWLQKRAKSRGFVIEPSAAQLLADLVGNSVGTLDRTLERVALYGNRDGHIELEDVEATAAPTRLHSIFELTDAIGARDLPKATRLLAEVMQEGEPGLKVLAMIVRQFRLLVKVKAAPSGRPGDVARAAGVPPFLAGALVEQARGYEPGELSRAIRAAAVCDVRLKSTRLDHELVLNRLLLDAMG